MLKSFYSKLISTQGFAFPLALLTTILVISLLVAGLAPLITTQAKHVVHSENQLVAYYAAQAAAKQGLRQVYDDLAPNPTTGVAKQPEKIEPITDAKGSLPGGIAYTYSYKYVSQNPERVEVTGTATVNNITAESLAWIVFKSTDVPGYSSPTLTDLVESANNQNWKNCYHWEGGRPTKTNTEPWSVKIIEINDKSVKGACPANGNDENIILFDNDFDSAEFTLDYNVLYKKHEGSGGVGIIYGASDSDMANKFNAYCVKFNNDRKALSVTKFIADNSAYKGDPNYDGRPVELCISYKEAGPNASGLINPNPNTTYLAMFQPNGKDPLDSNITNFDGIDSYGNIIGRCSIPFSEIQDLFTADPQAGDFSIKIETELVTVNVYNEKGLYKSNDIRLRHNIYLKRADDDSVTYKKVLSFIDFSDVGPVKTRALAKPGVIVENPTIDLIGRKADKNNLKKIRTGLRVWDVEACAFYSNIKNDKKQTVYNIRHIIWKK